jgi:hypothetical protein
MRTYCPSPAGKIQAALLAVVWIVTATPAAHAQLEITEVMLNPLSFQDNAWEWIEVRNLGGSAVNLDGAFAARVGDDEVFAAAVDGSFTTNTVIPAGGTAVLYDANLGAGNPSNFNDQQFRDAWSLSGSVSLIGVDSFPALTNGGTAFGFWADDTAYANDVSDIGNGPEVTSLTNTLFSLDYTTGSGYPPSTSGISMRWSGNGNYQIGNNWALSAPGEIGVVTSTVVSVIGSTNNADDRGSPGMIPAGGTPAAGLLITEIMYNPASPENNSEWEWVEIYNNTGSTIDFGATPYVLDDNDNGAHGQANIFSGSVADDSVAVLYNADQISQQDIIDAWDPGGANGTNFVGVSGTNWTGGFANGGDTVALWDDFDTGYLGELVTGTGRTTDNAVSVVEYDDDGTIWPFDDGDGSIYLTDLSLDQNTGTNWLLSVEDDGLSFNAAALSGNVEIHPGGEIGSPGTFSAVAPSAVDLDGDGDVDGQDFLQIQRTDSSLIPQWESEFSGGGGALSAATTVPEPSSMVLLGLTLGLVSLGQRDSKGRNYSRN